MTIELFGLPGSGKSTLARALAEKNNFEIIKIRSKEELIFLNFIYFLKHPIKFFATFIYIIKNSRNCPDFYYKFTNTFLHHNAKYQKASKCVNAILDQGHLQNVLSVFENAMLPDFLKWYLKFLPRPDKLIILNLTFSKIRERTDERGYVSRSEFGPDYFNQWLGAVGENYRTFLKLLGGLGLDYEIIDADQNPEQIYDEAKNYIHN